MKKIPLSLPLNFNLMDELEEIKSMLEYQGRQMEQLIWQVMGNKEMKIKGVNPSLEELQKDVSDIKQWREGMWKIDLKKLMTAKSILSTLKFIAWVIGVGTGGYGVHELIKFITS